MLNTIIAHSDLSQFLLLKFRLAITFCKKNSKHNSTDIVCRPVTKKKKSPFYIQTVTKCGKSKRWEYFEGTVLQ
jgi:hypothetical protein